MKYISCEQIENGITFDLKGIRTCCRPHKELYLQKIINNEELDIDKYLETRKKYKNIFKSGEIPTQCNQCSFLEEDDWDKNPKIRFFTLAHIAKCSSNCIYCDFSKDKEYFNSLKHYRVLSLLKTLKENNLIASNAFFNICGGECTEYTNHEFEDLLDFIVENNCFAHIFTSGMFYSQSIVDILKKGLANVYVSPDSGNKETFEKIKRVNYYEKFWEHIKLYTEASISNQNGFEGLVVIKYIIIPGINDNTTEFDEFIQKCREINCKEISISLEQVWWAKNRDNEVPQNILALLKYSEKASEYFNVKYIEGALDIQNELKQTNPTSRKILELKKNN